MADYTVHLPVLRKLAESFLVRANENEGDVLLANLEAKMEAQSRDRERGLSSHDIAQRVEGEIPSASLFDLGILPTFPHSPPIGRGLRRAEDSLQDDDGSGHPSATRAAVGYAVVGSSAVAGSPTELSARLKASRLWRSYSAVSASAPAPHSARSARSSCTALPTTAEHLSCRLRA